MENNIPEDLLNFLTETPMVIPTAITNPEREQPYVKIVEEPAKDLYKFRYESEGDTAGAIPGEKQQRGGKSFPKIILCNHTGPAILQVCAVTDDLHVHPNKLVSRNARHKVECTEYTMAGLYRSEIMGNTVETIKLGVNMSRKSDVQKLIQQKQDMNIDPFNRGFSHADINTYKSINLNKLRLCFSVTIQNEMGELTNLPSVYTRLIEHSPNKSELRIREISDSSSSSAGGEKKVVICDRLDAVGIQIVFYDKETNWTGFGDFRPEDIHHKSCIVFRTPAYVQLLNPTTVVMKLRKIDGSGSSEDIDFTYYPSDQVERSSSMRYQLVHREQRERRDSWNQSNIHANQASAGRWTPSLTYTYQDQME